MATPTKFYVFSENLSEKVHNVDTDTLKVYLSNATPSVSADSVLTDLADLSTTGGYTAGGSDTQNATSAATGTTSITGVDVVWTGSGSGFGPFRYVPLYNDTPTSPADPLIQWWDYGAAISVLLSETFTVDFGSSQFTVA